MKDDLTGLLNSNNLRIRLSRFLEPLSPVQHVAVASATYVFLFTAVNDIITCCFAPLLSIRWIVLFPYGFAPTVVGVVLPCCILIHLYSQAQKRKPTCRKPPYSLLTVVISGLKYIGILSLLAFLVFIFMVAEIFFPFSELPFINLAAAVLLIQAGRATMPHIPAGRRRALIAMFVLLILSVRYIDWISSKPFARHMFQVHRGMTGVEVERLMSSHLKDWNQPESEHYRHLDPNFTGEVWYRHTTEGWGNADWGKIVFKDGRAVDAEICICD
jgi:hypothetical protein